MRPSCPPPRPRNNTRTAAPPASSTRGSRPRSPGRRPRRPHPDLRPRGQRVDLRHQLGEGGGHDFGITLSTATFPNTGQHVISVGVTDVTTGWFKEYQVPVATKNLDWAKTGLDIKTPDITWKGTTQNMSVKASTPWGSLDLQLKAKGPALKAAGTGSFPLYGKTNYEYALPSMQTTGTLSVQNKNYKVSGET
ncbi:lipocalin-like domain-containing protein [Streptomyces sp. NL15-2K]|uniref:lipocalin-like domain-containing protein n=1 Tax=Streptomyces sp. NL15-2K TaxID=376149 RepID=UPI000FFA439A|nr:lipocalin-like domain-containing protein [Kutzneria buriramensis]WKX06304.1 lipocalin-like domain-containing protein [Kutzneria buriramensis]GCB52830.1 hypothetical protein SNL152K_10187 [Streptomyces sp. NL15-2K]